MHNSTLNTSNFPLQKHEHFRTQASTLNTTRDVHRLFCIRNSAAFEAKIQQQTENLFFSYRFSVNIQLEQLALNTFTLQTHGAV